MKDPISNRAVWLSIAVLAVAVLAAPVNAGAIRMQMQVPFEFVADGQDYPAGTYVVGVNERFHELRILGHETATSVALAPRATGQKPAAMRRGVLRFNRYGDTCVLQTVWNPGELQSWDIKPTARERELAHKYSAPQLATFSLGSN